MPPKVPRTILCPGIARRCWSKNSLRPAGRPRHISAYGYEQAKVLTFSKYGEPIDVLRLHGHSISPAHSNQVTIRFLAAPINPADINQIQGVYPAKPTFSQNLGTAEPSAVAGNEGVAEVISVGSGVKTLQKGDWVVMKYTGQGTWRTHAQLSEDLLTKIDDKAGLTQLQVGTVSVNPVTAYRMLKDFVSVPENGWFIQNGANSGVGRAAIQLGKLWGYKSINVIRNRPGVEDMKRELQDLGANVVVTEDELMERGFSDKVKEWTNGGREPIKLALNCVGGKPATTMAKVMAPGAKMVTYGAMSKQPLQLPAGFLIFKNYGFEGFWVSKWSDKNPDEKKKTVDDILQLTREGKFKDVPFQEVKWDWDTPEDVLKKAAQGTLEGFRAGKGVFVFGET